MKKFTKMWAIAACALFAGTAAVNAEEMEEKESEEKQFDLVKDSQNME